MYFGALYFCIFAIMASVQETENMYRVLSIGELPLEEEMRVESSFTERSVVVVVNTEGVTDSRVFASLVQ